MSIGSSYLALHNQGFDQDSILYILSSEYGKDVVTAWAAINAAESPEGAIAAVIKDRTKYAAPSLREFL